MIVEKLGPGRTAALFSLVTIVLHSISESRKGKIKILNSFGSGGDL